MLKWVIVGTFFACAVFVWLGIRSIWAPRRIRATDKGNGKLFSAGTRVTISEEHGWAKGAEGTITEPPSVVRKRAGNWRGLSRCLQTSKGAEINYWVYFDQPQDDIEEDGPFIGGEINSRYLLPTSNGTFRKLDIPSGDTVPIWYELPKGPNRRVCFKAFIKGTCKSQEAKVHFQRGYEAFSRDQYEEAISHYSKALEKYPASINAYRNRGVA